ncbi:hypothetical protein CNMCM7691_003897 [Aspergillus felis]|uniref:HypA-like protein n=1 Tax=Aspergillus felis TaxID=1287682 RepID=A0A8H6R326_9EURO|nr:hypothetical protein CNMCM7691_003897 [Aspergillus felis]
MATPTRVHIEPHNPAIFSSNMRADATDTLNDLLQENMENHHVYFGDAGMHVHHLLAIYALGASPESLKEHYCRARQQQQPAIAIDESVVQALSEKTTWTTCTGNHRQYQNFLAFFQRELAKKSVEDVLLEYLFKGDERADDMLVRMFSGIYHSWIHLGYALEFRQPCLVAEALAQTAIHWTWSLDKVLKPAEQIRPSSPKEKKPMLQILNEMRSDASVTNAPNWDDMYKIETLCDRATNRLIHHISQFTVAEDEIDETIADIMDVNAYMTAASQNPTKELKLDFFFIHGVNATIFLSKLLSLPFISTATKLRLLTWRGRNDLIMYACCRCPALDPARLTAYPVRQDWETLFAKGMACPQEDGHISKMLRALAHAERVCAAMEREKGRRFLMTGDAWLKLANICVDSVPDEGSMFVRSAGWDEAWEEFGTRMD